MLSALAVRTAARVPGDMAHGRQQRLAPDHREAVVQLGFFAVAVVERPTVAATFTSLRCCKLGAKPATC